MHLFSYAPIFQLIYSQTLSHFGDVPLSSIGQAKIGEWRDARLATVSTSTVLRERNLLHNLLSVARKEWKWTKNDPFDSMFKFFVKGG